MKTLLIIDFYNTIIRSLAVHQDLEFDGIPTGGLFGTLNQLANVFNKYSPTDVLVCRDAPPYLRKKDYPEYKQDRKKDDEKSKLFYEKIGITFNLVEKLFDLFDIPIWSEPGYEADDLIAEALLKKYNQYEKIFVLSNDDDLNQLLHFDNLVLLRKNKEYTKASFKEEYPTINPEDWVLITALCGTHNGVKGIPRVGLKTAIKYYNDLNKLDKVYEEHEELIQRNFKLILLPYNHLTKLQLCEPRSPKVNETLLVRYVDMYGIRYAQHMSNAFYQYSTRKINYGC
jgi:DNA polymerase-1